MSELKDFAAEYVKQIQAADQEQAMMLIREFGQKAYESGWSAALARAVEYLSGMRIK